MAGAADVGSHNFWTLLLLVFPVLTVFGNVLVVLGVYRAVLNVTSCSSWLRLSVLSGELKYTKCTKCTTMFLGVTGSTKILPGDVVSSQVVVQTFTGTSVFR